jgi:molecular chaperone DnaK
VWRDGRAETVGLGTRAPVVPSVVVLRDDGEFLVGEAAERRAANEPQRVAREFKRRLGDPTPIMLAGTPVSADALMAKQLRWTTDKVTELEGGPPAGVAISHPANWGDYKKDLLGQAIRQANLDGVVTLTEPEAAAIHYASQERVPPGSVVAVYDLGGGTFDASILRKTEAGWDILGEPEGIERLGGIDFDEAMFQHVVSSLGDAFEDLDPDDATAMAAVARLRRECVAAKEALASDTDASVPVMLPSLQTEVRVTRSEFEDLIRPALTESVAALHRALRTAGVEAGDVTAVLLVGGSSRIPLVAQLVGAELARPVAVDAHPKHGVALGAAITAADAGGATTGAQAGEAAREPAAPGALAAGAAGAGLGAAAAAAAGGLGGGDAAGATPGAVPTEPIAARQGPEGGDVPPGYTGERPTEPLQAPMGQAPPGAPTEVMPPPVGGEPPPLGGEDGEGEDDGASKKPLALLVVIAAVVVMLIGGGVAFALTRGDDGPAATTTETTEATTTTTEPQETTTTAQQQQQTTTTAQQQTTTTEPQETTTTVEDTTTTTEPPPPDEEASEEEG